MSSVLETCVSRIDLGEPQRCKNIIIVPAFMPGNHAPEYLTLTEALGQKVAIITEVGSGTVPEVKVTNNSDQLLLLVEGEELVGARQNRALNTSILVPAKSDLVVPVSCTERGRWHHISPSFMDAGYVSPHKLRKVQSDSVRESLVKNAAFISNQAAVWEHVDCLCACLGTISPTHAMVDALVAKAKELEDYLNSLKPLPDQKGLIVVINGEVAGLDIVSSARAYQVLHPKFIRSYAVDALAVGKDVPVEKPREKVERFLAICKASAEQVRPSVGAGEDHRLQSDGVAGAALVHEGTVLHLNLYRN